MHSLPLVVFLTLAAGPDRTVPVGCREDFQTCREDCTIDYGGSTTKYRQLSQCIEGCEKEKAECTTRHYSLRDTGYDAPERESEAPAKRPEQPWDGVRRGVYRAEEEKPAAEAEPAVMKEPEPESKPEPEPEPEPKAEPEPVPETRPAPKSKPGREVKRASAKSGDIRVFDDADPEPEAAAEPEPEPEPAPRPAPKRAEPPRPVPPAEPKKKDISDWDPNER